ncbi:lipase [Gloeophyllum trabeum ATCC 11539]|uniref:Lipase n=1 Tax=Gloeophyllum trabeum (strain ATCC 11539 / FP-39264 / Madison 617) TaxID=670483 RepID=S7Q9H1_GLOTA|nr:lipase [Gloeophyllum trabeum ATCC 11539]EPQ56167.1 lipase [Gloeophyllum trabeum ATCC 11539]
MLAQALTLLSSLLAAAAAPALAPRQAVTTLSSAQVAAYRPYTYYASTAYCAPAATLAWSCGANCEANSAFEPVASGGDGTVTQYWYVGYDPGLKTVIVAHQGTDTEKIIPDLTDADIILESLDPSLFPGVSSSIQVHQGFASTQARSAPSVLAAVNSALSKYAASSVTVTGHSLGAAIALLDFVYLPLHLPAGTAVRMVGYGMPRVGNQAFADYVDAHGGVTHVNNKKDPVPILPGRFLGFRHPSGEVHVQASGAWDACPGQDDTSALCTVGDVPNIFESDAGDHDGPYDGVEMGC